MGSSEIPHWGSLDRLARISLAHLPTPLEPLERLSRHLGGPRLLIKRDDCTGLAFGGNKVRKLEFVLAEAIAQGAEVLVTQGAIQSNHARQTAAAAARLGLQCHLVLENRLERFDDPYLRSGNMLLDALLGATWEIVSPESADAAVQAAVECLGGPRCFVVPAGGASPRGALGYTACAREMLQQAASADERIDHVVHVTGSASTHAGLLAGFAQARAQLSVIAVALRKDAAIKRDRALELAHGAAELAGFDTRARPEAAVVTEDYVADGYGVVTDRVREAIKLLGRLEGIIIDPVYSAKALAAVIDLVSQRYFDKSDTVVLLHSGGTPACFAYAADLA